MRSLDHRHASLGPTDPRTLLKNIDAKDDLMSYVANKPIETWIGQETPEEVLEPDLTIIDPHSLSLSSPPPHA